MPRDKRASYEKIILSAKKEFLNKGFEKASIRAIAADAGLSSAALYRHFADKEEMFAALVEPLVKQFQSLFETRKRADYQLLETGSPGEMWGEGKDLLAAVDLLYQDFEMAKLLICQAKGTRYEHFVQKIADLEEKETMAYLKEMQRRGFSVGRVQPAEMKLIMGAYVNAVFEVVVHGFSREEAAHYVQTLQTFFYPGWRAVLGF